MSRGTLKPLVVGAVVISLLLLLMAPDILPALFSLCYALILGWWPAVGRLGHAWHPSAAAVCLFFLAVSVLVAGTHYFLGWLSSAWGTGQSQTLPRPWRWKSTLCGFGMVFCGLAAICGIVLTIHQLYWMSRSPDPFCVTHGKTLRTVFLATDLRTKAEDCGWAIRETQTRFYQIRPATGWTAEDFQAVWIERDEQKLRAIIVIPRHPLRGAEARFAVVQPGANLKLQPLDQLPQVLASFGIGDGAGESASRPPSLR